MEGEYHPANVDEATLANALRAAIEARGVTLAWLQERLTASGNPLSMATLSYWRSGARRPEGAQSLSALAEIESLLGLSSGTLSQLVGPSQRVGPMLAAQYPLDQARLESAAYETFAALGHAMPETSRDVSTHSVTEVGADGFVTSRTTRSLIQATSGTVVEVPYLELSPGIRTPPPIYTAIAGCRIVRRHSHPSGEVHGVVFELERPVGTAQTALFEWKLELPADYPPSRETGHGVSRQSRDTLLWTRFHPDALPDWCEESIESPTGTTLTPLSLNGGTSIHQVQRAFGPGMLALRWGYEDQD